MYHLLIFFTACVVLKVNFLTMTSTLKYGAPLIFTETILAEMAGRFSANMVAAMP